MPAYDNFAHGALAAQVSDPATAEVQQLLQLLGYSPGTVDGIWGTKTQNALQALWMALGKMESPPDGPSPALAAELRALVARGASSKSPGGTLFAPPPASSVLDLAPTKPAWLSPALIVVGGLGLLGMGYLFWRESQGKMGDGEAVKADTSAVDPMDAVVESEAKSVSPDAEGASGAEGLGVIAVKKVKQVKQQPAVKPCPRAPDVDFDTGTPLTT